MRALITLSAIALGFVPAQARDVAKRTAVVDVDGVEVRSGHALAYPAVGQLRKGDSVIIVREEETGFLAILPPAGSVSWIRQIHLGKVEPGEGNKANVPVAVEGAEVLAGSVGESKPTNRITARLPKGTIVETLGPPVRIDNASWFPITPPEGDLRWLPKSAIRASSMTALAPPAPYERPDKPGFTVSHGGGSSAAAGKAPATALPRVLTDHRLWAQATQAEKSGDFAAARTLYARIYQDLWDQKAERDAIVICYNRYTRCDEVVKKGDGHAARTASRSDTNNSTDAAAGTAKWSNPGYLSEVQKVFVDGQQVFAIQDDRMNVIYYVTAVAGINLKNYSGRRVQVYGVIAQRPELYRPHISVERIDVAK